MVLTMAMQTERSASRLIVGFVMVLAGLLFAAASITFLAMNNHRQAQASAQPALGGPFKLTMQDGEMLSSDDLAESPFVIFFGFTHCPEVCPTTLWEMSEALKSLGADAERLKVLFVSLDPERDTQATMKRYLQSFDGRIIGLTGTSAEIEALAKSYHVYWKKIPLEDGDYTMDHTASLYMMDGNGHFLGTIAYQEQAEVRLAKLRRLLAGNTGTT